QITPSGSRGFRIPKAPHVLYPLAFFLLDLRALLRGGRLLTLTTVGAKSGEERRASLRWFRDGEGGWLIVGSNGGPATPPAWIFNLARNPDKVSIRVGGKSFHVHPQTLDGEAYDKAWSIVVAEEKGYARYRELTDRRIPIVRLTAVSDGSSAAA